MLYGDLVAVLEPALSLEPGLPSRAGTGTTVNRRAIIKSLISHS